MKRIAIAIFLMLYFIQPCLADDSFYGERELELSIKNIKRWNDCLERNPDIMAAFSGNENEHIWLRLLEIAKKGSPQQQIFFINGFFNKWPYIKDQEGKFLTPQEFIAQHGGDCEDYAIIKMYALELLGFSRENMRVCVYIMDEGVHANLVVAIKGEHYVLDNSFDNIVLVSEITNKPRYSFNANGLFFRLK